MADSAAPQLAPGAEGTLYDDPDVDAFEEVLDDFGAVQDEGDAPADAAAPQPEADAAPTVEQPAEEPKHKADPNAFAMMQFVAQMEAKAAAREQHLLAALNQLAERLAPQAPAAPDPIEQLDPSDPDYPFKLMEAKNAKLERELAELKGNFNKSAEQQKAERDAAEQRQQTAALAAWRDDNVTRAVGALFNGFPKGKQVDDAKDTVAVRFDSEWRRLSEEGYGVPYHKDAYATAYQRVQAVMPAFAALKAAQRPPQPAQTQTRAQAQSSPAARQQPAQYVPYFQRKGSW